MSLYIYYIAQDKNTDYDSYDSAVVVAKSLKQARNMHPNGDKDYNWDVSTWCASPEDVYVELLGVANKIQREGVVCASFNAG